MSLTARIITLRHRHQTLEQELSQMGPSVSDQVRKDVKKRKLWIKDEIEYLQR